MSITVTGITDFEKYMKEYLSKVSNPKQKQRILRSGALVVRRVAKRFIPKKKDRYVYTYNGKKVVVQKPFYYYVRGKGRQALVVKGNLANSIYAFRTKIGDVELGPRRLRKVASGTILGGMPKSSSGYYASSLAKSATNFRKKYLESSYNGSKTKVLEAMRKTFERIHKQLTR